MRYKVTPLARQKLQDIYSCTFHNFGERQADLYLRELDMVFQRLCDHPQLGLSYKDDLFQFVHGRHIIVYRIEGDVITIGQIFHGSQRR